MIDNESVLSRWLLQLIRVDFITGSQGYYDCVRHASGKCLDPNEMISYDISSTLAIDIHDLALLELQSWLGL